MIWMFFGLCILFGAYLIRERDDINEMLKLVLILMGSILILIDSYAFFILPSYISQFYNNGAGITVNNQTFFGSADANLAYFISQVTTEWQFLEYFRFIVYMLGFAFAYLFISSIFQRLSANGEWKG